MENAEFQEKANLIRFLLETEGRVMLCLDATQKGVDVPRRFASNPGLLLVLNSKMPQPIHILADSIASELRFGGIPHYCVIPYTAVWGAFNPDTNHGMTWPHSIPGSLVHSHGVLQLPLEQVRPVPVLGHSGGAVDQQEACGEPARLGPAAGSGERAQSSQAKTAASFLRVIEGGGGSSPVAAPKAAKPNLRLVE